MDAGRLRPNSRSDRRRRGDHPTVCKCPNPFYSRPDDYKPLPGELGHAQKNLIYKDKETGLWHFRRRVSRAPVFVFLRPVTNRVRRFRPEKSNLIDALFVVLIDTVDQATGIVTINLTTIASRLSPKDSDGNVIHETAVTVSRISRLIDELIMFGVLEIPADENRSYDAVNRHYFPKHVIISESGWKLTGVNIEKLRAQQEQRLEAEANGIIEAGEEISLKSARQRWYDRCRTATLIHRRTEAVKQKQKRRLSKLAFDDRKLDVASRIMKRLPAENLYRMSDDQFEKMVWQELYQLGLGLDYEPEPPPTTH